MSLPDDLEEPLRDLIDGGSIEQVLGRLFSEHLTQPPTPCSRCRKRNAASGYAVCDPCREYSNERKESLKKAGCCPRCKASVDGQIICNNCLKIEKDKRTKRKENGKCVRCDSKSIPGKTICETCRAFDKQRVVRLKQSGVCIACHVEKAVTSKTICEGCSVKRSLNVRRWRASKKLYEQSDAGKFEKLWRANPTDWSVVGSYYRALKGQNNQKLIERLVVASFDAVENAAEGLGEFLNVFSFVASLSENQRSYSFQRPIRRKQYVEKIQLNPNWVTLATKLTPVHEESTGQEGQPSTMVESLYVLFRTPNGFALNVSHIRGIKNADNGGTKFKLDADTAQYISM